MSTQERARVESGMASRNARRMTRIDQWLAQGGQVLASTDRSARSLMRSHDAARQTEGRFAWPTPAIFAWDPWVREHWQANNTAGWMLLNSTQEEALWRKVIRSRRAGALPDLTHLDGLAAAAQSAHVLLCEFAPEALRTAARSGWTEDAAIFGDWLTDFDQRCRQDGLASASRLPLLLTEALRGAGHVPDAEPSHRSPLLLIGFDRMLATQTALLNAWGPWELDRETDSTDREAATDAKFLVAQDSASEVAASVHWLRAKIEADPGAQLLVVTPGLDRRRGELERALLQTETDGRGPALDFEFSLGVPLGRVGLVRSGLMLMRWLGNSGKFAPTLSESELDWLVTSGYCAADAKEEIALATAMFALREAGRERPEWNLEEFVAPDLRHCAPPAAWADRLQAARRQLWEAPAQLSSLEWVGVAQQLLATTAWPGYRPLSSVAFQARQRWQQLLDECGTLSFDGGKLDWAEFVQTVARAVSRTIFAAESRDAQILITEPLASAGLLADGVWFLGAHEEKWPGRGQPHPLLPIGLQRESAMPHSSPMADWTLAREATARLLASADEVVFSYPHLDTEAETRPSRLISDAIGDPERIAEITIGPRAPAAEDYEDLSRIGFPLGKIPGGSATLTRQSLCPFQAFATARLKASSWEPAEAGLNAKQRGQLLHSVLNHVWGEAGGIRTLDELRAIPDLHAFVAPIVSQTMHEKLIPGQRNSLPDRFPQRYLELEQKRLATLVSEWLIYERERMPFHVAKTEIATEVTIAGLTLNLQLDRIDTLPDGSQLVVDYKGSEKGPAAWRGQRPDDVQLPLYATLAVQGDLEGLVFARVRAGTQEFAGRARNAQSSLMAGLSRMNSLVKDPLTQEQMDDWRELIERLGNDFLTGKAEVDPKDPVKVCGRCNLHAVCRIYENESLAAALGESQEPDGASAAGGGDA